MTKFYVYEHWRTDTHSCFYVGKGHGGRARVIHRERNPHHQRIVSKLSSLGLRVDVRIVHDGLSEELALSLEMERIAHWRMEGVALTNLTAGGEGMSGYVAPPAHREKIAAAHRGTTRSQKARAAMTAAQLKRFESVEARAAISRSRLGMRFSEEHRANLSAARRGKPGPRLGMPRTEEDKAKISAALKGRSRSPESIAKQKATRAAKRNTQ